MSFQTIQYFIFASVLVYFIYDYFENKKLKDEREEFLKLKTFELVHKATIYSVALISVAYMLYPQMPAFVPIIVIVLCSLYSEIFGKIFFRRKY